MMRNVLLTLAILIVVNIRLFAGNVTLELGYYPEKPYVISIKQGIVTDTIHIGLLDKLGKGQFIVPEGYAGMANLSVGVANFEFILNNENCTIRCSEEHIHGGNVTFENSPENESLQRWFYEQSLRQQKIGSLSEAGRFYEKEDAFFPLLEKEKNELLQKQEAFEKELKESPLYAARFIQLRNFLNKDVQGLFTADSIRLAFVRSFVRDSLDINDLFTSGLWYNILNGLLVLYDTDSPYHDDYISDMSQLLKKAKTDRAYKTLAENLFAICESMNWNDPEEELAYFLINDGRIKEPTGRLKMLMTLFKLAKGSKAPVLSNGKELRNTLLVFYESGCSNCERELAALKEHYASITSEGYDVISVSADVDELIFKKNADQFPWQDKFCDLKGFQGPDFVNYGIVGTPTYYVINKDGIITGRYARLQDTGIKYEKT